MLWVEPGVSLSRELSPGLPAENLHLQAHTSAVEASASELCTGVLMVLRREFPFCAGFPKGVANHAPVMIGCVLVSDPPTANPGWLCQPTPQLQRFYRHANPSAFYGDADSFGGP